MLSIEQDIWGLTPEGEGIVRYRMRNSAGCEVELTNLGATITAIRLPDREGKMADVALGYANPLDYWSGGDEPIGQTIGRYAGRIGYGRFELEGGIYRIESNHGRHHQDGGSKGLQHQLWESRVEENRIVMEIASPEEEKGWPGNLYVQVIFDFDDENSLEITWRAATDRTTHLNLSNYLCLNLNGEGNGTILEHEMQLRSSRCVEWDQKQLPTGQLLPVTGSAFDFQMPRPLGEGIKQGGNHLEELEGYDHYWLMDEWEHHILKEVAMLRSSQSGRRVEILSSMPAIRCYTGNCLSDGTAPTKSGREYPDHGGIILAPMYLPDTPNQPQFPSTRIEAGELYCEKSIYRFSIDK